MISAINSKSVNIERQRKWCRPADLESPLTASWGASIQIQCYNAAMARLDKFRVEACIVSKRVDAPTQFVLKTQTNGRREAYQFPHMIPDTRFDWLGLIWSIIEESRFFYRFHLQLGQLAHQLVTKLRMGLVPEIHKVDAESAEICSPVVDPTAM